MLGSRSSVLQSPISVREREVIFSPSPAQSYPMRAAAGVKQNNVVAKRMAAVKNSMVGYRVQRSVFQRVVLKAAFLKGEGE